MAVGPTMRRILRIVYSSSSGALKVVQVAGTAVLGKVIIRNSADSADIDPLADSTFTGRIGEVQASPTSNTVLARLKDLLTGIVLAAGTNVIGKIRLVTANGDEITDDTNDAVKTSLVNDSTGSYTTPTHTAPSIGSSTTPALAANSNRLYALFINDSDETIYLKFGASAVSNEGVRLNASGGSYEMSKKLGNLYTGAVNGICASGSKVLLVTEGV